jgi:hypothetical protein
MKQAFQKFRKVTRRIILLNNAVESIKNRSLKSNPTILKEKNNRTIWESNGLAFDLNHFKQPKEVI